MQKVLSSVTLPNWLYFTKAAYLIEKWDISNWQPRLIGIGLSIVWLVVLLGFPAYLNIQIASWLTFIALLVMPGYLLADILMGRLDLDWLERLALAFPLSIAVLAIPGMSALLWHLTITELTTGWIVITACILAAWLLHGLYLHLRTLPERTMFQVTHVPWAIDEIILLVLLLAAFIFILPILSLPKIDGDAYAVNAFVVDALAGLPLNTTEPLFGTRLGPGVRMIFNQSLPMTYLWAHLAAIGPNTLISTASRQMIALWIILAAYMLGKAAGNGSRRFGLFTASIQMLIYLAAPFIRSDNISLFFFERTNADKFMVPTTILPVVFALAIRYGREGRREIWFTAAVVTFAVSTIHPLIATLQAVALAAFAGLRLLLNLRSAEDWKRTLAIGGLAALVMVLPIVQLFIARGEAPLAPSFPSSFEGWPVGNRLVPVLPFVYLRGLDIYGSLPNLDQLEPSAVNATTNPFLIWRFAVNMSRRRLIVFDLNHYISDPSLVMEPAYLLALFLLPFLLRGLRTNPAAQFSVSTTFAVLFIMFNPAVTPLIGSLVMPWILWRFVWLLPYTLIISLVLYRLLSWTQMIISRRLNFELLGFTGRGLGIYIPLGFILALSLILSPQISRNLQDLTTRSGSPVFYPVPRHIFAHLNRMIKPASPAVVLADQALSVTMPAYVTGANVVAHRAPTTSEIFPADQQLLALQRLIDQHTFFQTPYLTEEVINILQHYDVRYIITPGGSDMDVQLRLAPQWFKWLEDDHSYSLYMVKQAPDTTTSVQGNTALLQRRWIIAEQLYQKALEENPGDLLALFGLAEIARTQGKFDEALTRLQELATRIDLPISHYRLGQLYNTLGQIERSIAEFEAAQRAAPKISRFQIALGDACLRMKNEPCAAEQYQAAMVNKSLPDEASRLIAQGDLWHQQGRLDQAIILYEKAVGLNPSKFDQFVLSSAYLDMGRSDEAEKLMLQLSAGYGFSTEVITALADIRAVQNRLDSAIGLYRRAIFLQNLQLQETANTRLALAQLFLAHHRFEEAKSEIDHILKLQPYNATAYRLQGDMYRLTQQSDQAIDAYRLAFELDPTQITVYHALSSQVRQRGDQDDETTLLQMAIQANPNEAVLFLALGDQQKQLGDLESAIDSYQLALEKINAYPSVDNPPRKFTNQSQAVIYTRFANAYETLGQLKLAMDYYEAASTAAPELPWPYLMLGDALRRRNDIAAAEAAYRRSIQLDSDYVEAYIHLADLLYAHGDVIEANNLYARALQVAVSEVNQERQDAVVISRQPDQRTPTLESDETLAAPTYYSRGYDPIGEATAYRRPVAAEENIAMLQNLTYLYQMNGQATQAIQLYRQKIRQGIKEGWFSETLAIYYKNIGDLYLRQGQLEPAIESYQQAVTLDNRWPEAHQGLAEALSEQGDITEALNHLQIAVELAPGSFEAQLALADAFEQTGEHDQAMTIYEATMQAYPGQAQVALAYARAWRERNRWRLAEQIYQEALALNPGVVEIYVDFAELLIDQGRYDEAKALLEQGMAVDQRVTNTYIRLGELEERRGRPNEALIWYRRAADGPLADHSPSVVLIDSLNRYGDYDTALEYLQKALMYQPNNDELLLRLGKIQRVLGQYSLAERTLLMAVDIKQTNSRLRSELAELYLAQGRLQEAITFYQQAIHLQPDEASYYLALSRILTSQRAFDQATMILKEGQVRASQPSVLYIALSNLYLQQGQMELALETLDQGILNANENEQLLVLMGAYYMRRGDFEQVERRYIEALEQRPQAAAVQTALGDLKLRQGDMAAALAYYEQAITSEPINPRPYLALAHGYRLMDQPDQAVAVYKKVIALTPTLVEAYLDLAALYEAEERWDEAQAIYEQGLSIAPTSAQLLVGYSTFLFGQGNEKQALALLDQAVATASTAPILVARAAIYREMGRMAEAEHDLRTALEKEPGSLDAIIALGDLHKAQGNFELAEQMYQNAVFLMPGVPTSYLRLGDLANSQGDLEAARRNAKTAHDLEPGSLIRPATIP